MSIREAEKPVLVSRFAFQQPVLFHPRARLYADQVDLSGWRWRGAYRRRLPLREILQVDALDDTGLLLWLASGETVRLRVDHAGRWKTAIERQQDRLAPAGPAAE